MKKIFVLFLIIAAIVLVARSSDKEIAAEKAADIELKVNSYFDLRGSDLDSDREYFLSEIDRLSESYDSLVELEKEFLEYKDSNK